MGCCKVPVRALLSESARRSDRGLESQFSAGGRQWPWNRAVKEDIRLVPQVTGRARSETRVLHRRVSRRPLCGHEPRSSVDREPVIFNTVCENVLRR